MSNNPHVISLDEAKSMTHAYQNATQFQGLTVASMIDKDAYQLVIDQKGCVNIRTYFALNEAGTLTIVVVGVDDNGDDMTQGVLLDMATVCPISCNVTSELMI
jgi:hypothetical protein